jgi:hypothetical protein
MAREIETGEIVALKKIRMDNEREGVYLSSPLLNVSLSLFWMHLQTFDSLVQFCEPKS